MNVIEIKKLGKKYNITHERGTYLTFRDVMMNIIRSPFAFLKTKAKRATGFEKKEEYWALKDVNLNIEKGDIVGIIGRNGAGKSTLLKILSQITPPTAGEVRIRGSVGSLLEVGTGFHPELTGRENIFLNGAILGMSRTAIAKKFEEIVEFAGIRRFLDTPVKYYSSGMYVRLAFSVAAHTEPDILIVDEVLAVGDTEFQKKCLGKMDDITKDRNRTVIFVSHDMSTIEQLCKKVVILNEGKVQFVGDVKSGISHYLKSGMGLQKEKSWDIGLAPGNNDARMTKVFVHGRTGEAADSFDTSEDIGVSIEYQAIKDSTYMTCGIGVYAEDGIRVFSSDDIKAISHEAGTYRSTAWIPKKLMSEGTFFVNCMIYDPNNYGYKIAHVHAALTFKVLDDIADKEKTDRYRGDGPGIVSPELEWSRKKLK